MWQRYETRKVIDVLKPEDLSRVLVVTAHPDDVDFGAAGTVALLTDDGVEVTYCLVTDGQAGGFDETIPRDEMARIRRVEQTAAAREVGVHDLIFLGYMDGTVEYNLALRESISRVIRVVRPEVVITQPPTIDLASVYASHPDHVATGQATFAAVYPDARNPFAYPDLINDGLPPWAVDEMWIMNHREANATVDITSQFDRKLLALMQHHSQHRDPDAVMERVREWNSLNAQQAGLPYGSLAETFFVADTR